MASDIDVHLPHLPASIGLGKESTLTALVAQSHQVGAPPNLTINNNDIDAYTTVLDALQVRRSLDVIIPHLYLYLLSSFASGHPPFKNYMGVDEIEETLTMQNEILSIRNICLQQVYSCGNTLLYFWSARIPWIVCRALHVRSLFSIWGLKSFMNCLNESVGSKKWSVGFYYFILLLSIMHNTSDDLDIQPVCSDGVVRINGLWWMPLLADYVGCLVLSPTRV
jgi:hypothetical protein